MRILEWGSPCNPCARAWGYLHVSWSPLHSHILYTVHGTHTHTKRNTSDLQATADDLPNILMKCSRESLCGRIFIKGLVVLPHCFDEILVDIYFYLRTLCLSWEKACCHIHRLFFVHHMVGSWFTKSTNVRPAWFSPYSYTPSSGNLNNSAKWQVIIPPPFFFTSYLDVHMFRFS